MSDQNIRDNEPFVPWPTSTPRYENWYVLVNHPTRRFCFWFRYTLLKTSTGVEEARVWAIPVDGDNPDMTRVATRHMPVSAFKREAHPWKLYFGDYGSVGQGTLRGAVKDDRGLIEWDFQFTPSTHTLVPVHSRLLRKVLSKSQHRSPNSFVRMSGFVTVDGERVDMREASAHQGHTGGSQMQDGWVWGRAGGFESDPNGLFEAVAVEKRGRQMCAMHVGTQGQLLSLNHVRHLRGPMLGLLGKGTQVEASPGQWRITAHEAGRKLDATVTAAGMAPVKVCYMDTDGTPRFNAMFPMASCAVSITPALSGSNSATTLLNKAKANVEFVARRPLVGNPDEYRPQIAR